MAISRQKAAIIALLSAVGIGLGTSEAVAGPLPALDDNNRVVVGSDSATVKVAKVDATNTDVEVTVSNNGDVPLVCADPAQSSPQGAGVTVTEASVVKSSMDFLENHVVVKNPAAALGLNPSSVDSVLNSGPLGSLGLADPGAVAGIAIQDAYNSALLAGHTAVSDTVDVPAHETTTLTLTLSQPTSGKRTDFDAGAIVTCTYDANDSEFKEADPEWFAFAGYEDGVDPDALPGNENDSPSGSLGTGSLSTASLGKDVLGGGSSGAK